MPRKSKKSKIISPAKMLKMLVMLNKTPMKKSKKKPRASTGFINKAKKKKKIIMY